MSLRSSAGLGAFEDLVDVARGTAINVADDGTVGDQPAALGKPLPFVDRRQPMADVGDFELILVRRAPKIWVKEDGRARRCA
jgi:hypothetical protein